MFSPSLDFLNQNVPLWFSLLMAFTAPHLWAGYAKKFASEYVLPGDEDGGENEQA
jgi:hypothetical protein